jgi:hypothetical protein
MDGNGNKTIILKYVAILYSFEEKFKSFFFSLEYIGNPKEWKCLVGFAPNKNYK